VVVDCGVDEAIADASRPVAVVVLDAGLASEHAPTAAVGDLAELLDVDVHQLARRGSLVAADD
jgi:hypothetical protein